MAKNIVWYEGNESGWAIIAPPNTSADPVVKELVVLTESGVAVYEDVPRRTEGGGHTWRPVK